MKNYNSIRNLHAGSKIGWIRCNNEWLEILYNIAKDFYQLLSCLAVNHFRGDLRYMQVSQLTIQHLVAAVMGCQLSVCVVYSTCHIMGSQLVFLEIETNL